MVLRASSSTAATRVRHLQKIRRMNGAEHLVMFAGCSS